MVGSCTPAVFLHPISPGVIFRGSLRKDILDSPARVFSLSTKGQYVHVPMVRGHHTLRIGDLLQYRLDERHSLGSLVYESSIVVAKQ
jgi:hypothetical protein